MKLIIGHLYPDQMNIYGDDGNILALKKRCEWRGIEVEIKKIHLLSSKKEIEADLYFFGGGQDQAQDLVSQDLGKSDKGKVIREKVEKGVPLLAICGGYQLLGEYYQPYKGPKLLGVGIFPVYTEGSKERMIGNLVISSLSLDFRSKDKGQKTKDYLVGFENHSGKTYLKDGLPAGRQGARALGKVIKGFGNNGEDGLEGCIYKNAIGCYMHGSLLPKNPKLADWLIQKALEVKYEQSSSSNGKKVDLKPLDDTLEQKAHQKAITLFS